MWKRITTTTAAVLPAIALVVALSGQARADGVAQVPWSGLGSENLPCLGGAHWTLSPGHGITAATVGIDTHDWAMVQAWDTEESWYIDTGPVTATSAVVLAYLGTADPADTLTLTNCVGEPPAPSPSSTPPPPAPGPSGPTSSPTPSPSPSPIITRHRAIVICPEWKKRTARHVKLVRFNADGVSVYRCVKP